MRICLHPELKSAQRKCRACFFVATNFWFIEQDKRTLMRIVRQTYSCTSDGQSATGPKRPAGSLRPHAPQLFLSDGIIRKETRKGLHALTLCERGRSTLSCSMSAVVWLISIFLFFLLPSTSLAAVQGDTIVDPAQLMSGNNVAATASVNVTVAGAFAPIVFLNTRPAVPMHSR